MQAEVIPNDSLSFVLLDDADAVRLQWQGKSTAREPQKQIAAALQHAAELAELGHKRLVLDFRAVEFLNSSSITPIVRVLGKASSGLGEVEVVYRGDLKWQKLIFSALEVFQTKDRRVLVSGV